MKQVLEMIRPERMSKWLEGVGVSTVARWWRRKG